MKNNDDIPTTDTTEIKQLINRVKRGELDQGDAQLIEKLLADFIPHSVQDGQARRRLIALYRSWVLEAPVNSLGSSGEDRTVLIGVVADGPLCINVASN